MNANRRNFSMRCRTLISFAVAIGLLTLASTSRLLASPPMPAAVPANAVSSVNADAPVPPDPPALSLPSAPTVTTQTIQAAEPIACSRPRVGDQIWLISTRQLGCGVCLDGDPGLRFWRYEGNRWQGADLKAFLAADDPHTPTDFYIHGNSTTAADANNDGFTVYDRLVAQAAKDRPMRFVIWSWPTDPGRHPLQLIRSHAYRADTDAWYLGWLLSRMDRRVPIGLAGYSFGRELPPARFT